MSASYPITEAQIVALFAEAVCYGIYLVSLGDCLRALLFEREQFVRKPLRQIDWRLLVIGLSMAVFASLDVVFGLIHNINAFVSYKGVGGAATEFEHVSYWVNIMKTVDYIAQTAIGDGILIYRLYVVFEKCWAIVIIPTLLWAGTLASGCALIETEISAKRNALVKDSALWQSWVDCLCALTLALNILVSALIIGRLWRVRSEVVSITRSSSDKLKDVIRIILDSGLVYTAFVTIFFATALARHNAMYAISDMIVQVIGITFNVIIVRVNNARGPVAGLLESMLPQDRDHFATPDLPPLSDLNVAFQPPT